MSNTIRIVAAVVDTSSLILYKEDGTKRVLPQGDPRIRKILAEAVPTIMKQGFADVDLTAENSYEKFEEKSSGGIKFFKVAKDKLKRFLGLCDPVQLEEPKVEVKKEEIQHTTEAVEEILQHAVPVSSPEFHEESIDQQSKIVESDGNTPGKPVEESAPETIIAVVDNKVIPGMEKIKTQFHRATETNTVGMENFLKRLGSVIEKRSHSVEDLLKFLERGDLPIADDGSILIYKVLRRKGNKFVDCHTQKVEQWVGAYVCMDEKLVDRNRNNECSNGLHVARRGYVGGFSGDVCVLAKLAPEDVIAVPTYDANKMRVCGYHIIMELSKEQFTLLAKNRPLTEDPEGKLILAAAMAGKHIGKTHEVRITGQMGNGVVVTTLDHNEIIQPLVTEPVKEVKALENPDQETLDQPVNPKEIVAVVEQLTKKQQAQKLYAEGKFDELKALKKAAKVSWDKLGVTDPDAQPKGKAKVKKSTPVIKFKDDKKPTPSVFEEKQPNSGVTIASTSGGTNKERIQKLLAIGITSVGVANGILDLKKKAKQSWEKLGVPSDIAADIERISKRTIG